MGGFTYIHTHRYHISEFDCFYLPPYTYMCICIHTRATPSHTPRAKALQRYTARVRAAASPIRVTSPPVTPCRSLFPRRPSPAARGLLTHSVSSIAWRVRRLKGAQPEEVYGVPHFPTRPRTLRHSRDPDCALSTVTGDTEAVKGRAGRLLLLVRLRAVVFCVSLWLCTAVCSIVPHAVGSRFREVLVMTIVMMIVSGC